METDVWADLGIDPAYIIFSVNLDKWASTLIVTAFGNKVTVWKSSAMTGNWYEDCYDRVELAECAYKWHRQPVNECTRILGSFLHDYFTEGEWILAALTAL